MLRPLVVSLLVLVGCSSSDGDAGGATGGKFVRSATCLAFQDSFCDWASDKCHIESRELCDEEARALFCKDDATVQACVDDLSRAECTAPPNSCRGIIDTAPAVALCNDFLARLCTNAVDRCKLIDATTCASEASRAIDCSRAAGASPTIDQCFADLDAAPCGTLVSAPPESCRGAVKALPGPTTISRSLVDTLVLPEVL
jgi:hypothetical protein